MAASISAGADSAGNIATYRADRMFAVYKQSSAYASLLIAAITSEKILALLRSCGGMTSVPPLGRSTIS